MIFNPASLILTLLIRTKQLVRLKNVKTWIRWRYIQILRQIEKLLNIAWYKNLWATEKSLLRIACTLPIHFPKESLVKRHSVESHC